ncbi:TRAP transporter permease [Paenalcaligenes sp. Me131]|uniref:TRAP transporter permease n=1 Tax=Paenalcaligenes sp. Me131 TaxID=3392636 RepID=UPI003D2A0E8C
MMSSDSNQQALQQMVEEVDRGGRNVSGVVALIIAVVALCWAFFQLWYASPLPFTFHVGIFNDTEARALHLGFALFLGYVSFPASKKSKRDSVPLIDWVLAIIAAFCGAYLFLFYRELALRPGIPTTMDIVVASIGLVLLLEATRRALGAPMAVLGTLVIIYVFLGPHLPDVLAHRGASLERLVSHMWLTTEGVFGVALGVSVSYIFIFVMLGSLLDRCGAGNYMMQVSFSLLGHLRGGPAKVSVVSSAVNGMVSASSVANVVTTGIFTIPLMKRAGYGGVRAGAIETAASADGQIMPPVMGAAAFLMIEYVGIPYTEIIKHALLPAMLSYISLFYIVHLEALRLGLQPMQAAIQTRTPIQRIGRIGMGISATIIVVALIYWIGVGTQQLFPQKAFGILVSLLAVLYVGLVWVASKHDDLPALVKQDGTMTQPEVWATVRTGLFFLIPIGILVWCLTIERFSPGLSAFWAVTTMLLLMLTRRPLQAFFRRQQVGTALAEGVKDTLVGLQEGARNMVGIALACGTAGLIVGTITLTGLGLRMTSFVELVSMGNVLLMLGFTAVVCLVLGLGMPTTANYILMATLMAPVVVELGAQSGLIIPLIAVHMFVFYYGLMADITPPVGLATFAAAAIAGEDPLKIGIQGFKYAMRTAVLPFMFVFNPLLLLIGIESWYEFVFVVFGSILGSLAFAAATMGWMRIKSKWWEILLCLVVMFVMFRPDWFMNHIQERYLNAEPAQIYAVAGDLRPGQQLVVEIEGMTLEGDTIRKTVTAELPMLEEGSTLTGEAAGRKRMADAGIGIMAFGDMVQISNIGFGSQARRSGWEQGWDVMVVKQPNPNALMDYYMYLPALLILAFLWWNQGVRMRKTENA